MALRKLSLLILGNAKSAVKSLGETGAAAQDLGSKISAFGKKAAVGFAAASAGAAAVGFAATKLVQGAEFAKQADDRLAAVAKSMNLFGAETAVVTDRLQKLADAQEFELGVTAETIKATQAKLMTFKNIGQEADVVGGAFDRATTAAIDLSAAGFGAAETNAVQLGKALQDPIKGITALARSGVTFTDQEKEKIATLVRSGEMLAAQDTLLKAIETQVGGTAAATATSTFKISAAFGHVSDEIGTLLLPAFEGFANFMVGTVVPLASEFSAAFQSGGFAGGVQFVSTKLQELLTIVVSKVKEMFPKVVAALGELATAFVAWVAPMIPKVVAALGELATAFVAWVAPMIPKVIAALQSLVPKIATWLLKTRAFITNKLVEWGDAFFAWVTPIIPKLLAKLGEVVLSIGNWLLNTGLPDLVERAQVLGDALVSWLAPLVRRLPSLLVDLIAPIATFIIGTAIPKLLELGAKLGMSLIKWTFVLGKELIIGIGGAVVALVAALPDLFAALGVGLGKIATNLVGFFIDKFKSLGVKIAEIAVGAVNFLIDKFNSIPIIPNIDRVTVDFDKMRTAMSLSAEEMTTVQTAMKTTGRTSGLSADQVARLAVAANGATADVKGLGDGLGGTGAGGGGGGGVAGKAQKAADAMKAFSDVVSKARDATRSQSEAAKAVGAAHDSLAAKTKGVSDAQARFDMVVRGFPASARESIDASRRFADAQRGVRDAGFQVADATRGVVAAEKALADLRAKQPDARQVGSAERNLERSKMGVEEANFRVADAEKALADLRLDPDASPTAIRRAEIDLAEAKFGVVEATYAQTDAESALAAERNAAATPDEIAEAERNLERAKFQVVDAIDAQTRATEEQSDAQSHLNEIMNGATVGSIIYESALKDLEDAKRDQQAASESLADALRDERDAMYELVEAQKALLAAQGATKAGVQRRVASGLGVSFGAGGSISDNIAAVSASAAGAMGGAGATNVTLNVQAGISNPVETANEIIDALRQWERANGSLPLAI